MHNEVFNDVRCFSYLEIEQDPAWPWNIFSRDRDPEGFITDLMRYRPPPDSINKFKSLQPRAVGFKLFPEHWTHHAHPTLQRLLADPRVKKASRPAVCMYLKGLYARSVHSFHTPLLHTQLSSPPPSSPLLCTQVILRRSNYLDVYASKLRADKSGRYIGGSLDGLDITIDPAAFQSFVEHYDACYAYYDKLLTDQGSASVLRLDYDELAGATAAEPDGDAMRGVLRFLGADLLPRPLQPLDVTIKQTREPLASHIVNYDEVRYAFSCTKVACCFQAD